MSARFLAEIIFDQFLQFYRFGSDLLELGYIKSSIANKLFPIVPAEHFVGRKYHSLRQRSRGTHCAHFGG